LVSILPEFAILPDHRVVKTPEGFPHKEEHEISALFHGAHYCSMEFNGNVDEIN